MANASNMETDEAPKVKPAPVCALLDHLPSEMRLEIYKMAFHGATAHAVLTMEEDPPGNRHHVVRFCHSAHFNLVRSCHKIFNEAMPTYWSETLLRLTLTIEIRWTVDLMAPNLGRELKPDWYFYHLCNSLPKVAKMNVRHIREILLPPLKGHWVQQNPQLTASALLNNFKTLSTCEIAPTVARYGEMEPCLTIRNYLAIGETPLGEHTESNTQNNVIDPVVYSLGDFTMCWNSRQQEPMDFLHEIYGINADTEVVFLYKTEDFEDFRPIVSLAELGLSELYAYRFWNFSNGVFCETDTDAIGDEQGYKMAMRPASDSLEESSP